ncbi:hypothetical protein IJD44_10900 [bacterium]|nr:hypothetical protein [bacterium]
MNNNKQLAPMCILVAVILFIGIIVSMTRTNISDLESIKTSTEATERNKNKLEKQSNEITAKQEAEEKQLNSIKPVMQEPSDSDGESLGVFGGMFDKVIAKSKESGLMLRSLEYEMNPADDAIAQDFHDVYNVCELKFFFVGTYAQLRSFIHTMINDFEYLVSISRLNISAFSDNTDYILINMSITLYSKKANK